MLIRTIGPCTAMQDVNIVLEMVATQNYNYMALTDILPNRPRRAKLTELKGNASSRGTGFASTYESVPRECLRDTVKIHHKLIVGMVHEKKIDRAYQELQTMFTALTDPQLRFKEVPLSRLLHGNFADLDHSLVNSYHLLLLQTLLQHVSGNLQLIVAGENGYSVEIFHTIACSLKGSRCILEWVEKAPRNIALKHYASLRKVATGFLKIIDFLLLKASLAQLSGYRDAWVLLQMKFSRLADPHCLIEIPLDVEGDFLDDLRGSIAREEPSRKKVTESSDPLGFVLRELDIKDSDNVPSRSLYSKVLSRLDSLSPNTNGIEIINNMLLAFDGLDTPSKETFVHCVTQYSRQFSSTMHFEKLLKLALPRALDLTNDTAEMVSMCFRYGNKHQHCEALLLGLRHLPQSVETEKRQGLRELTLKCLVANGKLEESWDATVGYIRDYQFLKGNVLEGVRASLPKCVLESLAFNALNHPEETSKAIAGLSDDSKGQSLLQASNSDELTNDSVRALFEAINVGDSTQKYLCQLTAELTTVAFLPLAAPTKPLDKLLVAAILTNRLKTASGPLRPIIAEITKHVDAWTGVSLLTDIESEIIVNLTQSLHHGGHHTLALSIMERLSKIDDFPMNLRLLLLLLSVRCLLVTGKIEEIPSRLSMTGRLMKQMAELGITIESPSLAEWKLYQFQYFISANNSTKANEKYEEISSFLMRKPEFSIEAAQQMSLKQSVTCLLLNLRFLCLTAEFQQGTGHFALALKNVKVAIKIGVSILKRLSSPSIQKDETVRLLLECYKQGFWLARHAGALNEAVNMILEMDQINDAFKDCLVNAMAYFELADMYLLIGDFETSAIKFEQGSEISSTKDMVLLHAARLRSSLLLSILIGGEINLNTTKSELLEALEGVDHFDAFSLNQMMSDLGRYEHLLSDWRQSFTTSAIADKTPRSILVKALTTARQEFQEVKVAIMKTVKAMVIPSGLKFTKDKSEHDFTIVDKLLDCKDTLLKFLESDYTQRLGVEEVKDLQNTLTACIFTLSQMTVVREEGAESLLRDLFFLLELPRKLPYESLAELYECDQKDNVLLPVISSEGVKNTEARDVFFKRIERGLPNDYLFVTIDVCTESGDLILTKMQKGVKYPSLLRLSLARAASGAILFESVMEELADVIKESQQTTSVDTTSNVKTKEERRNWWKTRFLLDARLKAILQNVEEDWVGGFRSFFEIMDHTSTEYLFFKSELQRVWKRNLGIDSLEFSDIITELYFNLTPTGNAPLDITLLQELMIYTASELGVDINPKKLATDLKKIYPVRRRAYRNQHLVLIPSHSCSEFPWESLEFLKARSVSRVPNMSILLDLLERPSTNLAMDHRQYYVLNPGGDLKKTEGRFKDIFASMSQSHGIAGSPPEEGDLIDSLFNTDLFFYAGHGGGEQYMRMTQLVKRRFSDGIKLPPAILMGCSSGALQKYGRLEPSSNIMIWLLCGSPMIVSNLWDITDKDIDAFSSSVLDTWGITGKREDKSTISEAVAKGRDACVLKYLNGAAPIVHGLPVRLD